MDNDNHVETAVLLSKGEIDSKKVRVEFSLEDMDMSGFQNDATYNQIKERVLEQTGLKVSSLYIAQVKQKHGIIERENYNKPKSENARLLWSVVGTTSGLPSMTAGVCWFSDLCISKKDC